MENVETNKVPQQILIWGMAPNTYCMLLHLSQFANCIFPTAGLVMPILMWVLNKDQYPIVDRNGRVVANWILSAIIYAVISLILCLLIVGFFLLVILVVLGIIFPIIGAVKANDGVVWKYPLSIPFFKVDSPVLPLNSETPTAS